MISCAKSRFPFDYSLRYYVFE